MAFKWIHNHNPFTIPAIIFASLLAWRWWASSRPGKWRLIAIRLGGRATIGLFLLLSVCIGLGLSFELYFYAFSCAVSTRYYNSNVDLAKWTISTLQSNGYDSWLDYATLLCQIRGQELNSWDHDVDISMIDPSSHGKSVQSLLDMLNRHRLLSSFDQPRNLIQVWNPSVGQKGPHIDLWLWSPDVVKDEASGSSIGVLRTADLTVEYNPRLKSDIFPLRNTSWLGIPVFVPNNFHLVSHKEFTVYGGDYMQPAVFRGDCFHNFFNGRFAY